MAFKIALSLRGCCHLPEAVQEFVLLHQQQSFCVAAAGCMLAIITYTTACLILLFSVSQAHELCVDK